MAKRKAIIEGLLITANGLGILYLGLEVLVPAAPFTCEWKRGVFSATLALVSIGFGVWWLWGSREPR